MRTRRRRPGTLGGGLLACLIVLLLAPARSHAALAPGDLVVADAKAFGGGALIEVDPLTGAESVISSNQMPVNGANQLFDLPFTLAIDSAGNILVANTGNLGGSCKGGCGGVIEVDPATGAESVLSSNAMPINASSQYFHEPTGITIDPHGNILVSDWGSCDGCSEVVEVDPTTGKETLISSNSMPVNAFSQYFVYAQGIVTDRAGDIFVADPLAFGGNGGIIEVNPTTGKESELSANSMPVNASSQYFHSPSQLTLYPAGNILVADWCSTKLGCGGIIEVDPQTGKETELSTNSMPVNASSQYFDEPTAVAVDGNGRIVTVQEGGLGGSCAGGCGGLLYVDPATGRESELSANSLAANSLSEFFVEPFDVAVVPSPTSQSPPSAPGNGPAPPSVGPSPGASAPAGSGKPVISGLAQSHRRWRELTHHGRNRRSGGAAYATVFSFLLNEPAQVTLEFAQPQRGRRAHGACVAASARDRHGRPCTYAAPAGALTIHAHAGKNTPRFAGSLSHGRTLGPGSYELTVMAESAAGTWVARRPLRFTIVA